MSYDRDPTISKWKYARLRVAAEALPDRHRLPHLPLLAQAAEAVGGEAVQELPPRRARLPYTEPSAEGVAAGPGRCQFRACWPGPAGGALNRDMATFRRSAT